MNMELHPERKRQLAIGKARLDELGVLIAMEPEVKSHKPGLKTLYQEVLAEAVAITVQTHRLTDIPVDEWLARLPDAWYRRRIRYLMEKS